MTNRDRKIEETREAWVTANKRKMELIREIWKVEEIIDKTKELLIRYGQNNNLELVQETTDLAPNHHCTCSCSNCNFRCRLGAILYGES